MIKAYLAGPIFTERDRNFNTYLETEILKRCPELDLYLAQNNASINDKTGCATSADIYVGDVTKLKKSDLLISIMSADMPPIGSSYETAYFCGLCEHDSNKQILALYDDCREASHTYSKDKRDAMLNGIAENQFPYINLLAVGYVKKWGEIYFTSEELINAIERWYKLQMDSRQTGIYRIINLKNNLTYIGQTKNFHQRWLSHKRELDKQPNNPLYQDIKKLGVDYFKFEILEKCDIELLDEREKYWITYYDTYNLGYNKTKGGSNLIDDDYETSQTVEVFSYDLDGKFIRSYKSIAAAMRDLGLASNNITRAIAYNDNCHKSGERMWRYQYYPSIPPYEPPSRGKQIYCYDLNTRLFIKGYKNANEAGKELTGKRQPHINDAANGKRQSCCGFLWSYEYYDRLPK